MSPISNGICSEGQPQVAPTIAVSNRVRTLTFQAIKTGEKTGGRQYITDLTARILGVHNTETQFIIPLRIWKKYSDKGLFPIFQNFAEYLISMAWYSPEKGNEFSKQVIISISSPVLVDWLAFATASLSLTRSRLVESLVKCKCKRVLK